VENLQDSVIFAVSDAKMGKACETYWVDWEYKYVVGKLEAKRLFETKR
jgi:hypothetical protein